ncbi:MAG: nitroreductase family deazaflavin-dependent oxidoreductase [Herpetosiphonaceae bacterium]|nr:nitroreductase family deazaflavin-dependent oxidoreductase [Herpetosiphonaceae bacterium]
MLAPQRPMNRAERLVARFLVSRFGHWFGLYVLPRIDRPLLRLSRGRFSMSPGQPILLLMSTGAKSGRRRGTPLLFLPDSDRIIVLASNGGLDRHPAWYYNVRAHPQVTVYRAGSIKSYVAREAHDPERAELWRKAMDYYLGFALYEQWTKRQIPVIVLEPHEA